LTLGPVYMFVLDTLLGSLKVISFKTHHAINI